MQVVHTFPRHWRGVGFVFVKSQPLGQVARNRVHYSAKVQIKILFNQIKIKDYNCERDRKICKISQIISVVLLEELKI